MSLSRFPLQASNLSIEAFANLSLRHPVAIRKLGVFDYPESLAEETLGNVASSPNGAANHAFPEA